VDDVELATTGFKHVNNALGVGVWLTESGCTHDGELSHIRERLELTRVWDTKWVWVAIQIKAGDWSKANTWVEFWVGLASKDFDAVA
jgi:hypothetical protein